MSSMKLYFSGGSIIFMIVSIVFFVIGSPILLFLLCIFNILLLVIKYERLAKKKKYKIKDFSSSFLVALIIGVLLGGMLSSFYPIGIILFGYWAYILYQTFYS